MIPHGFCGSGIWERLCRVVLTQFLHEIVAKQGLQSPEGVTGAGGTTPKHTHMAARGLSSSLAIS